MQKVVLKKLDIYTPISKDKTVQNDDFDRATCKFIHNKLASF